MAVPYRTPEETNDRISQTVVMFGNDPVYVVQALADRGPDNRVYTAVMYVLLPAKIDIDSIRGIGPGILKASILDERWRCHDFNIGYVNQPDILDAAYMTRIPIRRYKQGLNAANLNGIARLGNFQKLVANQSFVDMLRGNYPNYAVVHKKVSKANAEHAQMAFARRWSLEHTDLEVYWLRYRGQRVASSQDGWTFHLPKKFLYLKELILKLDLEVQEK